MSCFCYLSSSTSQAEEWTWGLTLGWQSLPARSRRVVTHSRSLCSHAPCSAVPGTHHTAPRNRGWLCPLPACSPKFSFSMPSWSWMEASILPCGVVCHQKPPILLRFEDWSVQTGALIPKALNPAVFYCRRRKLTGARTSSPLLYVSATAIWLSLEWVSCSYQSTKLCRCDCS